jgi:small-conductance mechanosensitive channel
VVPIGVRYGTDPEQVLELLLEAAREHEEVIALSTSSYGPSPRAAVAGWL